MPQSRAEQFRKRTEVPKAALEQFQTGYRPQNLLRHKEIKQKPPNESLKDSLERSQVVIQEPIAPTPELGP